MANYRTIHTKLWTKGWFEEADAPTKLLFIYLLTNPSRNESCVYEITVNKMANDTGLVRTVVVESLATLERLGKIKYDRETSIVWVVNALEYMNPNSNCVKAVWNDLKHCNSLAIANEFKKKYRDLLGFGPLPMMTDPTKPVKRDGYKVFPVRGGNNA